ncbi:bacteriorhodopsin [Hymenobacter sp.]|jgi:bacteriorhodopsin|uniref:bacteriorhodopsin n=1 Tax=Hymenobacter sp. TaxID=1898978 RepID=UPI002ED9C7CE
MPAALLLQSNTLSPGVSLPYYYVAEHDLVGATFFFSMFALLGAAIFFFTERSNVPRRWRVNMTVSGIICLIAGISYYYMQGMYLNLHITPTRFRYIDWLFTVPLMCTQFYLLMRPEGATPGSLWRLFLGAVWMVGFGYFGESSSSYWSILWGAVSTLGYMAVVHEIWFGPLAKLVDSCPNEDVGQAFAYMSYFILIGWSIYPLGYLTMPFNLFENLHLNRNLVYNFADVFNKVGFSLVLYCMARKVANRKKVAVKKLKSLAVLGQIGHL